MDIKVPHEKCYQFIKRLNSTEERLDSIAIIDGKTKYTYREMFNKWEEYARAFSALGITGKNNSSAMIFCTCSKEATNLFYALNMTGAVCSFGEYNTGAIKVEGLRKIIEVEKITDLIIWDWTLSDETMKTLEQAKDELGIRNIIIYHTEIPKFMPQIITKTINLYKKWVSKKAKNFIWLDDIVEKYSDYDIDYTTKDDSKIALITHTSGTLKGVRKPIAFTDRNLNAFAMQFIESDFKLPIKNPKGLSIIPPCTAYGVVDGIHLQLSMNCTLVEAHFSMVRPNLYIKILKKYSPNVILTNYYFWDNIINSKEAKNLDLSSLIYIGIGGSKASPDKLVKYNKFLKDHNCTTYITNGYGLSETGGASIVTTKETVDDSIGVPLPGVDLKIYDEKTNSYKGLENAPIKGELLISTEAAISGEIYGNKIFEPIKIKNKKYVPTGDLVKFEKDGTVTYIGRKGRSFQFFDQRNCQPEVIEDDIKRVKGVKNCLVVPKYYESLNGKSIVIYFEFDKNIQDEKKLIHDIITREFLDGTAIEPPQSIPKECVVVDKIPLNIMSKEKIHDITEKGIKGRHYNIKQVGSLPYIKNIIVKK